MKRRKEDQVVKLPKGVSQEFLDVINPMSRDELKAQIVTLQVQNQENEEFKESPGYIAAEEEFQHAKDRHNEVVGPIKETSIAIKNRTKVVVDRLKERGGV